MAAYDSQIFGKVKIPNERDKVYKDECCLSFDNAESKDGIFICMNKFLAFGKKYVENYSERTQNFVFLHHRRLKKEKESIISEPEAKKPTRLALGFEGGFPIGGNENFEYEDINTIVVLPNWTVYQLTDPSLPPQVIASAKGIISAESAARKMELENLAGTWDGEKRIISKFSENLTQLGNNKKVPPSGWKCERCDLTDNLWLNLTDGSILCGRKFFDGSGGNNHASEHYLSTKYPLAVKLGTITPEGADVYSYPEDDMVEDPHLAQHLAHFGIDIMNMQKTEKTMIELELDLNQRAWEWTALTESSSQLQPVYGPGYTGMYNLGNSCYMNSVLQILFNCLPAFSERYFKPAQGVLKEAPYDDPASNFNIQICKLAHGLLSGEYSQPPSAQKNSESSYDDSNYFTQGIRPQMFKNLIGRGHAEFSTNKQQDVAEFILHLFSIIERNSVGAENPTDQLKLQLEERLECSTSGKVKYHLRNEYILGLSVDLDDAVNKDEVLAYEQMKMQVESSGGGGGKINCTETVRPKVRLSSCLENFATRCTIEDFYSSAAKRKTTAYKTTRLKTFPEFLLIQLQKFSIGSDWVERKLDVCVEMPDSLDINHLRGRGLQPTEEELPDDVVTFGDASPKPCIDEAIVSELVVMGFPLEGCRKAAYFTKNQNLDAAVNWIMEHIGDPDLCNPLDLDLSRREEPQFMVDETAVQTIVSMGFTQQQALRALKATDNSLERAMDWIFSHADDIDEDPAAPVSATPASTSNQGTAAASAAAVVASKLTDGPGNYKLVGFISHMGSSCKCGHYVCHILKSGKWVIYNDEKVALSENPPKDLGYLYLYQRV